MGFGNTGQRIEISVWRLVFSEGYMMDRLKARVDAENGVNALANYIAPKIIERAKDLVGSVIVDSNGQLCESAKKVLDLSSLSHPEMIVRIGPSNEQSVVHFDQSMYFLRLCFRTSRWCVGGSQHACASVVVGDIIDGVLRNVDDFKPLKADYIFEEVLGLMNVAMSARAAYVAAIERCGVFSSMVFESDFNAVSGPATKGKDDG